jgi:hypothetical protein
MSKPRVFVDFNSQDTKRRLRLSCVGTQEDLERQQITLRAGMELTLYEDDTDEHGGELLVVDGVVEYSDEDRCWAAVIDWDAIQYVPATPGESASGKSGSPPTPAATPRVTP